MPENTIQPSMGIGKLSKLSGVNIETIRFYERAGVIPTPPRTDGGHRTYDDTYVRRLAFISRSRQLGFSLKEIHSLLGLADGTTLTCADIRELTLKHAAEVNRKISDLRKLEKTLKTMAAQCHGNKVPECPIIDALFEGI